MNWFIYMAAQRLNWNKHIRYIFRISRSYSDIKVIESKSKSHELKSCLRPVRGWSCLRLKNTCLHAWLQTDQMISKSGNKYKFAVCSWRFWCKDTADDQGKGRQRTPYFIALSYGTQPKSDSSLPCRLFVIALRVIIWLLSHSCRARWRQTAGLCRDTYKALSYTIWPTLCV